MIDISIFALKLFAVSPIQTLGYYSDSIIIVSC